MPSLILIPNTWQWDSAKARGSRQSITVVSNCPNHAQHLRADRSPGHSPTKSSAASTHRERHRSDIRSGCEFQGLSVPSSWAWIKVSNRAAPRSVHGAGQAVDNRGLHQSVSHFLRAAKPGLDQVSPPPAQRPQARPGAVGERIDSHCRRTNSSHPTTATSAGPWSHTSPRVRRRPLQPTL
jgi:hypothetical protein